MLCTALAFCFKVAEKIGKVGKSWKKSVFTGFFQFFQIFSNSKRQISLKIFVMKLNEVGNMPMLCTALAFCFKLAEKIW